MASAKKVVMRLGKETIDLPNPTHGGVTALERLGWEIESGAKPPRPPKQAVEAQEPFDEAQARAEIAASLRAEIEAQVRAEVAAEAEADAAKSAAKATK
jgi:hypothetical protein